MSTRITNYKIEGKVVETMLITSAFFLLLMAFRHKNTEPCRKVDFSFRTANRFDVAYEKERVYFSSELKYDANSWEWDFGDKSPNDTKSGPYATHEYDRPGEYTVRLIINGRCTEPKRISIAKRPGGGNKILLRQVWPQEPMVAGSEYTFIDSSLGANSWKWFFGKDERIFDKQSVMYRVIDSGEFVVTLVINNDLENGKVERRFTVQPAPSVKAQKPVVVLPPPPPLPPPPDVVISRFPNILDSLIAEREKNKIRYPEVDAATLSKYITDISGKNWDTLKKSFKDGKCKIIFNGADITPNELRMNMAEHAKFGKLLSISKKTDPVEHFITTIHIIAELKPEPRKVLPKALKKLRQKLDPPKPRKYPYPKTER